MRTLLAFLSVAVACGLFAGAASSSPQSQQSPQSSLTLTAASSRYGRVLFDGNGRVLYGFTRDRRGGPSRCYGACARAWPVYFKRGALRAGNGVKRSLLGTTKRKDGRLQVTYNGWPLYYYVGDTSRGAISCQNVNEYGGLWLVVSPAGRLVR